MYYVHFHNFKILQKNAYCHLFLSCESSKSLCNELYLVQMLKESDLETRNFDFSFF